MTILSVGIGLGYADAGPTHYATEDYACLRAIGGTSIYTASDNFIAEQIAKNIINQNTLNYVRLDRNLTENIDKVKSDYNFEDGYRIIGDYSDKKIAIVSHGKILHNCLKVVNELNDNFFIVDLYRSKPISDKFVKIMKNIKKIIVVDEQTQYGNLTSAVQSELAKNELFPFIKNISLPDEYVFMNGGRDYLLKINKMDEKSIFDSCSSIL